jgi:tryptophan-rich sensory protein
MQNYEWYALLVKPFFAPPAWIFGPVWSFLYAIIIVSFGYVFYLAYHHKVARKVALPFILNIIFNLAFTPLQFGLQNLTLASIDILLVLTTIVWGMVVIYPKAKWVAYAQIPYLLWVSFATVLQFTILFLNW